MARTASGGRAAALVAAGILASRLFGLVRQRVFAHYFGVSPSADAFNAAFRIPNLLQNLFGEGVLSASFIPVYARLLAEGKEEEAGRVAGAIAAILALVASLVVLAGVLATPVFVDVIAPGFEGETRELTIRLVRVLFPGAGLLVLSAWCLGVLNSHRRFFLSYVSPVLWNVAMIATMVVFGALDQPELAVMLAWGSVAGSALQLGIQLPVVFRLARGLRFVPSAASDHVRTVVRNFGPVFVGRGVVQLSAFVDMMIATLLGASAVSGLAYAQTLSVLPVSLFGMSVSAAELPAMSSAVGSDEEVVDYLHQRLAGGLRRIAFFVVPSAMAFLALGDVVAGAIFQTGNFTRADAVYVWAILAGSAVGLLAITLARLYSSTFYALRDTKTPLKFATAHVVVSAALGFALAVLVPPALGIDQRWGAAGLTAAAGIGGWVEFLLLRRALDRRIGKTGMGRGHVAKLWAAASVGAALAWAVKLALPAIHPIVDASLVLAPYGLGYFGAAAALGVPEVRTALGRVSRLAGRGRK
jgi:putative peptidoglycan lipid II flippase